jgi:hypothetical protein
MRINKVVIIIIILRLSVHALNAQSLNLKIGVGLYKSFTNLKKQEQGGIYSLSSFNFRGQQQFNIVQNSLFTLNGISLPIWLEYKTKREISFRAGVVIGESVDLGYQRTPNYNTAYSNTNVPQYYTGGEGLGSGIFVTRFPIHVSLLGINFLPVNKNLSQLILSPVFGLEFMSIISASDNGLFSQPAPFFIVEDDGSLTYYETSFMFNHYKTKDWKKFNLFGSFGLSLRFHRKNKEILELLFSCRANLNPNASPFAATIKIDDPNNLIQNDHLVYNFYFHKGNSFSITLNFPIRLNFINKRLFKN